jgi:hypothetical protein
VDCSAGRSYILRMLVRYPVLTVIRIWNGPAAPAAKKAAYSGLSG